MIKDMNDKEFSKSEVALFENQYMDVFKEISKVTNLKKSLERQEAEFKEKLEKAMDQFEIKSIDNDYIKITRIAENPGKQTIDIDKMKKEEPKLFDELLEDYPKITGKKKAYIKFEVKSKDGK